MEGGYRLIIEYEKNKSDEILRFKRDFYVFRLPAAYAGEPVESRTKPPPVEKKIETSGSVQKAPDKRC